MQTNRLTDFAADLERRNFATARLDPTIDQERLSQAISRFKRARRRQLALDAMPEPVPEETDLSVLLMRAGV